MGVGEREHIYDGLGGGVVEFFEINGTTDSHSLIKPGRYTLRSMFHLVTAFCSVHAVAPKLTTPLVQSSPYVRA